MPPQNAILIDTSINIYKNWILSIGSNFVNSIDKKKSSY
jgi:hypothetical protein